MRTGMARARWLLLLLIWISASLTLAGLAWRLPEAPAPAEPRMGGGDWEDRPAEAPRMEAAVLVRSALEAVAPAAPAAERACADALDACLAELERAFTQHYTPRALDAQLAACIARHQLDTEPGLRQELCRRLEAGPSTDALLVRLVCLARGASLTGTQRAGVLLAVRARTWRVAEDRSRALAERQEALRGLAAVGGLCEIDRLCAWLIEATDSEEALARQALASAREAAALAPALERSLTLVPEGKAQLIWSAVEQAAARALGAGEARAALRAEWLGALEPVLLPVLERRAPGERIAECALSIYAMLAPEAAEAQALRWLETQDLPVGMTRQALHVLRDSSVALEHLERTLSDPRAGTEARLLAIESRLRSEWPQPLRLEAQAFLRTLAQQPGVEARRALHALGDLGDPEDLDLLRALALEAGDPLSRAAARSALVRAESEWLR